VLDAEDELIDPQLAADMNIPGSPTCIKPPIYQAEGRVDTGAALGKPQAVAAAAGSGETEVERTEPSSITSAVSPVALGQVGRKLGWLRKEPELDGAALAEASAAAAAVAPAPAPAPASNKSKSASLSILKRGVSMHLKSNDFVKAAKKSCHDHWTLDNQNYDLRVEWELLLMELSDLPECNRICQCIREVFGIPLREDGSGLCELKDDDKTIMANVGKNISDEWLSVLEAILLAGKSIRGLSAQIAAAKRADPKAEAATQVRKTPSWPRSCANFSLL
jgi:hypothetical protein